MKSAPRTIIFASPVSDFRGGAERSMFELILNTKNHGYTPIVIVPRKGEIEKKLKAQHIKTHVINYDWWARSANDKKPSFNKHRAINGEAVIKITQILEQEKPVVCVSYTAVFPWLAYAASITNTPHIWQVCEILEDSTQWRLRSTLQATMSVIGNMSVKIFANSVACKDSLVKNLPAHKKSIDVIYPYINQTQVIQAGRLNSEGLVPVDRPVISIVGNIQPSKGQLDAVRAVHLLKENGFDNILLLIIGVELDSIYAKEIRKTIKSNRLENNIIFTNYTHNPHVYVKNSDIALMCSPHEAFGRVTVEAMLLKTPVIGVDADGTREIIGTSGKYGLLYKSGDYVSLSMYISRLLNDKGYRNEISDAAFRYVSDRFTMDKNHAPFFDFLESEYGNELPISAPFTDIVYAYELLITQKKMQIASDQLRIHELESQLNSILTSKKWKYAAKLGSILHRISKK